MTIARPAILAIMAVAVAVAPSLASAQSTDTPEQPPSHTTGWPGLGTGQTDTQQKLSLEFGPELKRGEDPREMLRQRRLLDSALGNVKPHRKGKVDAFVVSVALNSDAVFSREAREAGNVLSRRYNAAGRTLILAGPNGRDAENALPKGSISALTIALASIAEKMDTAEDVLVLYATTHGTPEGLAYHYGDTGYGVLSPKRLRDVLNGVGIQRRVLIISACFSGVFVPQVTSPDTAILTASTFNRSSFGCQPDNDWTFFGDALINRQLRKPVTLEVAAKQANSVIAKWETTMGVPNSLPQLSMGQSVKNWLPALEAKIPKRVTKPTGKLTEVKPLQRLIPGHPVAAPAPASMAAPAPTPAPTPAVGPVGR